MKFMFSQEKDNATYVGLSHLQQLFVGIAKLHPEDNYNHLRGYRYAEQRAMLKAYKAELREKKRMYKICKDFVTAITQYKNFDPDSPTTKAMYRQLNRRKKEVEKLEEFVRSGEDFIKDVISADDKIIAKNKAKEINE